MNTAVMTPRGEAPRRILAALAGGPATQKELCDQLNRSKGSIADVVRRLERGGYITATDQCETREGFGRRARYYAATGLELPAPTPKPFRAPKAPRVPRAPRPKKPKSSAAKPVAPPKRPAPPTEEELLEAARCDEIIRALALGPATHRDLVSQLYRDRYDTLARLKRLVAQDVVRVNWKGVYTLTATKGTT